VTSKQNIEFTIYN